MKVGFIGSGKVGASLGKLFSMNQIHVTGYYSQHEESAKEVADFVGCDSFASVKEVIQTSDIIFLTVPDGKIKEVYDSLDKSSLEGKIICHTSGSLSASECFIDAKEHNIKIGSVHPLYPVSTKFASYEGLRDAFFVLEGEGETLELIRSMLQKIGLKTGSIKAEDKVKYHAACAIASNLVCGVLEESLRLLEQAGFSRTDGLKALTPLIQSNVSKVLEVGPKEALTGPMERGDLGTIEKHIGCLNTPAEVAVYKAVSGILLEMAKERHPQRDYTEIEKRITEA